MALHHFIESTNNLLHLNLLNTHAQVVHCTQSLHVNAQAHVYNLNLRFKSCFATALIAQCPSPTLSSQCSFA